jgi:hypothetical protein
MEYHGSVPYCYANSVAMLLSAQGEQVYPGLVEVLTGVGLGAVQTPDGQTWLSTTPQEVPAGVDRALELLGFAATTATGPEDADVLELLRADLVTGPVMLGPLDMGHLTYIPWHGVLAGSDHYLVAYAVDGGRAWLQDPAGFPCTALGREDLARAWRAERIGAPGGPFRRWLRPRRVAQPTPERLYGDAMASFRAAYRDRPPGGAAIRELAKHLAPGGVGEGERGLLTAFTFPLGARRALDYAAFFAGGGDGELAAAKQGQARLLGECLLAANRDDWSGVAGALEALADLEEELDRAFTGGRSGTP